MGTCTHDTGLNVGILVLWDSSTYTSRAALGLKPALTDVPFLPEVADN